MSSAKISGSLREQQYLTLRKEILGPRDGFDENIEEPKTDYVTGVLQPVELKRNLPSGFGVIDLGNFTTKASSDIDTDSDDEIDDFEVTSKLLHPLDLPKSMGISFILDKSKTKFDFCVTFARYEKPANGWKRKPFVFIQRDADATKNFKWNIHNDTVQIRLISHKLHDGNFHISLFLVNTIKIGNKSRIRTNEYIFQPQLRINLEDYNALHPVRSSTPSLNDPEEKQLALLYRNQKPLARGHMTGAVWKEIDPERPFKNRSVENIIPDDISEKVFEENGYSKNDLTDFINPHLRTDYLPSYSIKQSTVNISNINGMKDEDADAEILAQKYDSEEFFTSLNKLKKAYEEWIDEQNFSGLDDHEKALAEKNLEECRISCKRIDAGIKILKDDVTRLAFCFMNKAMATQSAWKGGSRLIWRPFQIAFILQCLEGIVKPESDDRTICDLLWYPTAGGKTEAYLGILIFTLALRRLKRDSNDISCYGTVAISRYTLRLLTIQQFRRALAAITACEYLRIINWNPDQAGNSNKNIWGTRSFSAGLWVGGGLTPNNFLDRPSLGFNPVTKKGVRYVGAASILTYNHKKRIGSNEETSYDGEEPAQILECPCCQTNLAIPKSGIHGNKHEIFLTVRNANLPVLHSSDLNYDEKITVTEEPIIHNLPNNGYYVIQIKFEAILSDESDNTINSWWYNCIKKLIPNARLECTAASRPGYFLKRQPIKSENPFSHGMPYDVEIRCPNQACDLNKKLWQESIYENGGTEIFTKISEPFRETKNKEISHGIPIPAYVVDSQIYSKCPSLIIATVDKFAQLPILSETSSMFGNIDRYDDMWGFFREGNPPDVGVGNTGQIYNTKPFLPPEIIIQDELHLIEGPLGSMVGLYEAAVEMLCSRPQNGKNLGPKYLVSTATIRAAEDQIKSLYCKNFKQFPPPGITAGKNFFSDADDSHPLDDEGPGRWYIGVMAPGRGPITPVTRIWAALLQGAYSVKQKYGNVPDLKYFWTVVGYFNAMRELAGLRAAYNQDIPKWVNVVSLRSGYSARTLSQLQLVELHSNIPDKTNVSAILKKLEKEDCDAVLATSMFGTGVDIDRLSQMIVHGQPKTTSSYIQATGRVGRKKGALIVTFLRSTRSRDLDHYEFFTGYHSSLHRYVEPVTVFPFTPGAVNKGILPVFVSVLRNGMTVNNIKIDSRWAHEDLFGKKTSGCRQMSSKRITNTEIDAIVNEIKKRNHSQPDDRIQPDNEVVGRLNSLISSWEVLAKKLNDLFYHEGAYGRTPKYPVVLGDEKHTEAKINVVNRNTPNSLRDVESTTRFRD